MILKKKELSFDFALFKNLNFILFFGNGYGHPKSFINEIEELSIKNAPEYVKYLGNSVLDRSESLKILSLSIEGANCRFVLFNNAYINNIKLNTKNVHFVSLYKNNLKEFNCTSDKLHNIDLSNNKIEKVNIKCNELKTACFVNNPLEDVEIDCHKIYDIKANVQLNLKKKNFFFNCLKMRGYNPTLTQESNLSEVLF